jgi:ATP-dependent 26S proteasome regulatory subunit
MSRDVVAEIGLLLRSGWRLVAFETFEEERALRVLERVAEAAQRTLVPWSIASGMRANGADSGDDTGSFDVGLQALSVHEEPAIFAILDAQRLLDDAIALRRLRDLLPRFHERKQAIVLLGPVLDLPVEIQREAGRIDLPLPGASELEALFRRTAEGSDPSALDAAVRAALGLTAVEAVRALRRAMTITGRLDDEAVALVVRHKRDSLRRTPALTFHESEGSLDDIGGLGELKRWLRIRRRSFGREARDFGLPTPRGLLLLGVQGCGKSMCAKAVAREWQFPLLRLDLAAAFGSREGSPEAVIREATAVAESIAPTVLWIDEIEKGFAASGSDPRAARVFGSFLTWLAEKRAPVFVTATANDVSALPPELLRRGRFDELFFVDLPTETERREIFSIHLRRRSRDPLQFDLDSLAQQAARLSGAEIEQVVIAALYTAFEAGRELEWNDLANAVNDTVPLYDTYEERIKELRDWARTRARPATLDARVASLFDRA